MSYKISSISIENFKLFGKAFKLNLDSDLIVFDGPNGFGKTTIFDAVELALTGNIRRLIPTEKSQVPTDVVVAHNNSSDVTVSCTLKEENTGKSIVIYRKLKNTPPAQSTKITKFKELWDTFIEIDGESKLATQDDIDNHLIAINLTKNYSMFHYIEQEDTLHFLKSNSEKQRAAALSHLLGDTTKVEAQKYKLELLEKRIKEIKVGHETRLNFLRNNTSSDTQITEINEEIEFSKLISWDNVEYGWDKEDLSNISPQERDEYLQSVLSIAQLVKHRKNYLSRIKYDNASTQDDILKLYLLHSNHLTNYQGFNSNYHTYHRLDRVRESILSKDFNNIKTSIDDNKLFMLIKFEFQDEFKHSLDILLGLMDKSTGLDTVYREIIDLRKSLVTASSRLDPNDIDCLLCGTTFESPSALQQSFLLKEERISKLLSRDEKSTTQLINDIHQKYLTPITLLINQEMESTFVDKFFMESLEKAYSDNDRLKKLEFWINSEEINISDLVTPENIHTVSGIDTALIELKTRILAKRPDVDSEYLEADDNHDFNQVYLSVFSKNKNYLLSLATDEVERKRVYIETCFQKVQSTHHQEIKTLDSKIKKLEGKRIKVRAIIAIYKREIGKYRKKLIKDIEIPFYIYSGKILQSHQLEKGAGIFIKDKTGGEELKNIRLVSDWSSDHDVLNVMSSGQISAIVISFLLSLNKIYLSGVKTLLIDDPVQTMDEINMISLVELLRNEFKDLQIILSTHESDVAKYFLYKFLKYGKTATQVNMMERKQYLLPSSRNQLSN